MQMTGEALEVAQYLETRHAQAAAAHRGDRGVFTGRMAGDVGRVQHDLREAGGAHRAQLGLERPRERDRVHAEVLEVHAFDTTSSNVTPPR
jgi:hypothetical protein